jgi:hypothetical protein
MVPATSHRDIQQYMDKTFAKYNISSKIVKKYRRLANAGSKWNE